MYKKYRLIKKYPGLPSDWSIGMEVGVGDYIKEYYRPCSAKYTDFGVKISLVVNYPEFWEEIKEPRFTTEDGVEINSNKKLYGVVLTDDLGYKAFQLAEHEYTYNASINLKDFKWFVDKDKAIEYIDMNKPRFSKKDLLDASINIQYGGWFIEGLIKRLNK